MLLNVPLGEGEDLLLHLGGEGEEHRRVRDLLVHEDVLDGVIQDTRLHRGKRTLKD